MSTGEQYFSLNLPFGPNQGSVPDLLDHLVKNLRRMKITSETITEIHLFNGRIDGKSLPAMSVQLYESVSIDE